MRPSFLLALLVAPAFAACLAPPDETPPHRADAPVSFDGLGGAAATRMEDLPDGARRFLYDGRTKPGLGLGSSPIDETRGVQIEDAILLDARVAFVELNLTFGEGADLEAWLWDPWGRAQCVAWYGDPPFVCTTPVPRNQTTSGTWRVAVTGLAGPDVPFELAVVLHPSAHLSRPDPAYGVDRSIAFRSEIVSDDSFEPSVGVLADGTILAQFDLRTYRSTDDGRTWTDVSPPLTTYRTFDPLLHVDPWAGDVYVDHNTIACTLLAKSSDAGATWLLNPAACGVPGVDHQKLATGPSNVPGSPSPIVYLAFSNIVRILGGTEPVKTFWISRSLDGGATWTPVRSGGAPDGPYLFSQGVVRADREGNVYAASYACEVDPRADIGGVAVTVSNDYGLTYRTQLLPAEPDSCLGVDPGVAIDSAGNVYVAWFRSSGVWYSWSADRGATWSDPVLVSPPHLGSFMHVVAVAGDEGRLAVGYLGTPDSRRPPEREDGYAGWHVYVSYVNDATGPAPSVRTALVNAPADPIHRGTICLFCIDERRNLGDFNDIALTPDGRVVVVFDRGCVAPCETPADSRLRLGVAAVQEDGPRLYENGAPWRVAEKKGPERAGGTMRALG